MSDFRKYLLVSTESGRTSNESWSLDRLVWKRAAGVENLADYDGIILDLVALRVEFPSHIFDGPEIYNIFDVKSWAHVLGSFGQIYLIGDPEVQVAFPPNIGGSSAGGGIRRIRADQIPNYSPYQPAHAALNVRKDRRPFDFRRVARVNESEHATLYRYLDRVVEWNYSFDYVGFSQDMIQALVHRSVEMSSQKFGQTTFNTSVAVQWSYSKPKGVGKIVLLPSATPDPGVDANWVAREFLGIATTLPPPTWTRDFVVPGQRTIEENISEREKTVSSLRTEIILAEKELLHTKRWLRLLYDDGVTLEDIVKEAFEKLGAVVVKTSKEKDDYRLKVDGYPEAVMEVKGTHNPKFNIGALRQLAGWMDEAIAQEGESVKGIFVGNAARTQSPTERQSNLFEENNEKFARLRDIVIIRAMDLYCLAILSVTGQLDQSTFWRKFFDCKGAFDAEKYWVSLSPDYKII